MIELEDILRILERASSDASYLDTAIEHLQALAWHTPPEELRLSDADSDRLKTLAYDLDFFVRNSEFRAEDSSYYGPDVAVENINEALLAFRASKNQS